MNCDENNLQDGMEPTLLHRLCSSLMALAAVFCMMESLLNNHDLPYDPWQTVIDVAAQARERLSDVSVPLPLASGLLGRQHSDYLCNENFVMFRFIAPLYCFRRTGVTPSRTIEGQLSSARSRWGARWRGEIQGETVLCLMKKLHLR